MKTFGAAFALTLFAGMYSYLTNHQLGADELFFLLLVFYPLVRGVRWLWRRFVANREERI
jgi:hypothetical protein